MLSPKIDLTEQRDFSGGVGSFTDSEVPEDVYDGLMTCEQYDRLCRWESIFGKRRHENQKRRIFPVILSRYNTKCTCCGKELRAPWMRFSNNGLCQDCEKESRYNSRIPWKSNIVSVGHFNDKGYRLFNSK